MSIEWKESIYCQREELARLLREPIERLAAELTPWWDDRPQIESILSQQFAGIPYCNTLYVLTTGGRQISGNISATGVDPSHYGRDRSVRPYMNEAVPSWGFLLSDAYISLNQHRPSITALQVIRDANRVLGYLGVDFDLRDLPATTVPYREPANWRQVKGDPSIRQLLFQQTRVENPMDQNADRVFAILEEMLTDRGVYQLQIQFSSNQATIWTEQDPFRYRILDIDALTDPDICLAYPRQAYSAQAVVPADKVGAILEAFRTLRMADDIIYLRQASINLFNGMVSLNFSCDGSHYMPYDEFLQKSMVFWLGVAA